MEDRMRTAEHDVARPTSPGQTGIFDIAIADDGRVATLAICRAQAGETGADELLRGALDALLSAGVVHGLDRALVAQVVAARDGMAHPVARASPPGAQVDGELDVRFAAAVARDPLHSVEVRTLLARCTPPCFGTDGVAVTGGTLCAPAPLCPTVSAGDGTEASDVGDGVIVVRALVEGRPRIEHGRVSVDEVLRVRALPPGPGPIHVFGSLEIGGDLRAGAHVTLTGDLRVAGDAERAHIQSGGDVLIGGSCLGSEIHAGGRKTPAQRLRAALADADAKILSASAMSDQLVRTAVAAGRRLSGPEALRAVLATRFAGLEPALVCAVRVLHEPDVEAESHLADAIAHAAAEVDALMQGDPVSIERIAATGQALARAMATMGGALRPVPRIEVGYLQASRVQTQGSLILTGAGTYNVDAAVGGDLRAEAPDATLRGGALHVGGVLAATELGAPGGAAVRVVLEGDGGGRRLIAGIAHAGVEVLCGSRSIVVEAKALNFSVGFDEENNVVCSGDSLG
jgi:hypothetical protein